MREENLLTIAVRARGLLSIPAAWYTADMSTVEATYLDRLLTPVTQCFTPEVAERLIALPEDTEVQSRIGELAEKANEGTLSAEERAEYEDYIEVVDLIGILQSRARAVLANHPNGS
jgi:hypothetical protein